MSDEIEDDFNMIQAICDLDIEHYPGKFRRAQEMAMSDREYEDSRHLLPYWERVRLFYLELGGEYDAGREETT